MDNDNPNIRSDTDLGAKFPADFSKLDPDGKRQTFMHLLAEIDDAVCLIKNLPLVTKTVEETSFNNVSLQYNWDSNGFEFDLLKFYRRVLACRAYVIACTVSKQGLKLVISNPAGQSLQPKSILSGLYPFSSVPVVKDADAPTTPPSASASPPPKKRKFNE
jgi:hypothetical protein